VARYIIVVVALATAISLLAQQISSIKLAPRMHTRTRASPKQGSQIAIITIIIERPYLNDATDDSYALYEEHIEGALESM